MILVTGGAGYIGSHMLVKLLKNDYDIIVLDNLTNSQLESINRVETITHKQVTFIEGDIRDSQLLNRLFQQYDIEAVFHFAGLKSIKESSDNPLLYFDNNINGTLDLLTAMQKANVKTLIFSSTASVYGEPKELPITESHSIKTQTNPYSYSKAVIEQMLNQLVSVDSSWNIAVLRYFNPIGAHESGLIGENPLGIPNNLLPYISQVAIGRLEKLSIFGNDYDTPDGTGIRDYIHVVDLVNGHLSAFDYINKHSGVYTWNLGTGQGYSVLDLVHSFERVNNVKIPYQIEERRTGDIACCYADVQKAEEELNWQAEKSIEDMMMDTWRWQNKNPNGYVNLT